ncbi:MAG: GNAT family N-acetyltransferase [Proteobacteria bacterium]|nr:GNAT family N-acetyltransferase [Pseudomonadota bacterium]MBU1610544.1 GNAT family N-acetyltransferase [Pseudomonadota bacterium]
MHTKARLRLAPVLESDLPTLFEWINDRELVLFNADFKPVSWEDHLHWFASVQARKDVELFSIREIENDQLIGTCQLRNIDLKHRQAELVIRIGVREKLGQGLGTEAVRLLCAYGFGELGMHRIYLHVFYDNERAKRAYVRAGFVEEGILRQASRIDGQFKDVRVMSLLCHEMPQSGEA